MKESLLAQVAGKISPYRDRKSTYLGWKKGSLFSFSKLTVNTKQKGSKPSFSHQHITLLHFPAREQERHTSCRLWPVARTKQRGCFHCPGWEGEGVLNSRAVKGKSTLKLISGPLTYLITYTVFFFNITVPDSFVIYISVIMLISAKPLPALTSVRPGLGLYF